MSYLRRLRALPAAERRILLEAVLFTSLARLVLALVPFRRVARRLGTLAEGSPAPRSAAADPAAARRIGWAVGAVGRHAPWSSRCLVQAVAGWGMLRRRRLGGVLRLGVARDGGALTAHAWLESGGVTVTGAGGPDHLRSLGSFQF